MTDQAAVSLLRWLRRQLRQPTPQREHLEAAVENDDPDEVEVDALRVEHHVQVAGEDQGGNREHAQQDRDPPPTPVSAHL